MDISSQVIKECVTQLNQTSTGVTSYKKGVADAHNLVLRSITEQQVEDVIQPFLYGWGKMGRVLGKDEYFEWQERLANRITSNASVLEQFRARELTSDDPAQYASEIKHCYDSFSGETDDKVVGPIAAAKTLHLLCPTFLPPWDTAIARSARTERLGIDYDDEKPEKKSGMDYFQFVVQVRDFIRTHDTLISELSSLYGKSKVKIVDECFWLAANRPLFILMSASSSSD